ncbi:MAG: transglutaminase family protein [Actinomycetota bacterium]|nr:transglutaminase family protein [Actinomycetota bacterium]
MLTLRVGCEFAWKAEIPTAIVVQVEPRSDGPEIITESWTTHPPLASRHYADRFGNTCRRLTIPAGETRLGYDARVLVTGELDPADYDAPEVAPQDLPESALLFMLPSRFCHSDVLADAAWQRFGSTPRGYKRVEAICDFVHHHLTFTLGSSTPTTTAVDVYNSGQGVCRDFAHLLITFCRALNIPARYAFGYLPDIDVEGPLPAMDFCAWTEVFLGNRWYTFDARNNARRIGRVLIGRGRDAVDVAMVTAYGGPQLMEMTVWADQLPGLPA